MIEVRYVNGAGLTKNNRKEKRTPSSGSSIEVGVG